jgi:hypothetical protein
MKFVAAFLFLSSLGWSAGFTTGQAARLVIGQRTFTAQEAGASDTLLGSVGGIAYANDTLVVADSNRLNAEPLNHRVLIYKNVSRKLPAPTDELPQGSRCPVCTGKADVVLGQESFEEDDLKPASPSRMRLPVGVATDGNVVAVADTDNNRVLLWLSMPSVNGQPADVVVGQPDFNTVVANNGQGLRPDNKSLRGPQGVWIQDGRLFVADTGNNRILIWNSIPRSNGQAADIVVGQRDFTTGAPPTVTAEEPRARPDSLSTPVSVTSDGIRMYVADLGNNRVLIWNSIPSSNGQPADVVIGQPNFEEIRENNSKGVCTATGEDSDGNPVYPARCAATLEFPRFALSDGRYLFIADGGNDRILVFNQVPTSNGAAADAVLGQLTDTLNLVSDSFDPQGRASAGAVRSPLALAWDGANLYATDPFNRRVMVFTVAERKIPNTGVRNAASRDVFAVGTVIFQGESKAGDKVTIKISDREYQYTANEGDTLDSIILNLVSLINGADDPDVFVSPNTDFRLLLLTARAGGPNGNNIEFSATVSSGSQIVLSTSGARLSGGQDAAKIAPGTIVALLGEDLAETELGAPPDAQVLPDELAGVQVYFDGIRAPLFSVSPGEVRAQIPIEVQDSDSINAYIRTLKRDGSISVTSAVAVPIVRQNPGIFAVEGGPDPRPALAFHGSSFAIGTVSVDGSVRAGDVATVVIEDREYSYTVQEGDTLASIRDRLIELINQDPKVEAFPASAFTRIRIRARIAGPEGNGIRISARSRQDDQVIMTATNATLCCANVEGAPITEENPAVPGETIIVYATGLGLVKPDEARERQITGRVYDGPAFNDPLEFVSSLAGGKTANVISAGLKPGTIGIYEVQLELNSDIPTNPRTQLTIAQDIFVSNIVTIPVFNPNPSTP